MSKKDPSKALVRRKPDRTLREIIDDATKGIAAPSEQAKKVRMSSPMR